MHKHYDARGAGKAQTALLGERSFDDKLMKEGVVTHYMLRVAGAHAGHVPSLVIGA